MSKLVVVAGKENIDAVSYSHAHTCTIQGHRKEFSHAHNPLNASLNMSKLVVAGQENIDAVSFSHAHTCTVQGHCKEFSHAHTCAKWLQPLLLPRQTEFQDFCHVHTCNPLLPDGIPGKLMMSLFPTLTPAPSFGNPPPLQTEFQEFCHVHTCTPPPDGIPGKLMTSAFSHAHTWMTLRS